LSWVRTINPAVAGLPAGQDLNLVRPDHHQPCRRRALWACVRILGAPLLAGTRAPTTARRLRMAVAVR
jgi:hypothetical protein